MIIACLASHFAKDIIGIHARIQRIKLICWFQLGTCLFPHILLHREYFKKEPFAITFTFEKEWRVLLADHLRLNERERK